MRALLSNVCVRARARVGAGATTWKDLFARIDADKSGTLDFDEMKDALSKLGGGVSNESVAMVMKTLDTDADGEVAARERRGRNHACTHTRTHARARAHTHTHTRTHTRTCVART